MLINRDLKIYHFRLSVHWVNCAYPFSCRGRHPLTLEKGLDLLSLRIVSDHDIFIYTYICDRRRVSHQTQLRQTMANLYTLTSENFDKHVEIGLHFIKFYAPWFVESRIKTTFGFAFLFALRSFCINSVFFFLTVFFIRCSHCRKLAPTWKALAEYHKDNMDITIAKVQ